VPLFYFRICNGDYSGTSGEGFGLADKDAAWAEMTRVCGDLVGGIARKLKPTIGMADGAFGRVPKARVQNSGDGGDAGSASGV
jgi:hypothetical protein